VVKTRFNFLDIPSNTGHVCIGRSPQQVSTSAYSAPQELV